MQYETGVSFDPAAVGSLQQGVATEADVRRVLGAPFGEGSAMMPYQDQPRLTWTYVYDTGMIDPMGGKGEDHLRYMFVFFRNGRMDGYLWFDSLAR